MKVNIEFDTEILQGKRVVIRVNDKKVKGFHFLKLVLNLDKNIFDFSLKGKKISTSRYISFLSKGALLGPVVCRGIYSNNLK